MREPRTRASLLRFAVLLGAIMSTGAPAATVYLSPAAPSVGINSAFQVDLDISGVNNGTTPAVGAFDVTLSFDPTLLNLQGTTFGAHLDPSGLGDIQSVTPSSGNVEVYEIALDSAQQLAASQPGSFTLASFSFYAFAAGSSPLALTVNGLSDPNGNAIVASPNNGTVIVTGNPVPLPPSIWLLLSGIALIAVDHSSRRARIRRPMPAP